MILYYADAAVELYLGDAREAGLLDGKFDSIVTDPPYGVSGGRGGDARDFKKARYETTGWEDTPDYVGSVCVSVIEALVATGKPMALTSGVRMLHRYPAPRDIGCFWTPASATHGPWGFTTFQPILYYGKDWRAGKGTLPSGKLVTERAEKNGHPCPKPIEAWGWLIDKVCPPGGTVLDPFVGSGTTLVAARAKGRKAIGIEIEKRYCDIAARRCEVVAEAAA